MSGQRWEWPRVQRPAAWLGLAALALGSGGCGSARYPLQHYEAAYTRAALESPAPDPVRLAPLDGARVARGRYLVEITGCGGCHTDGAVLGQPDARRLLAGSGVGIAYTDPFQSLSPPGVAYPANLTPDAATGLGGWSDARIAAAIRAGNPGSGAGHLVLMAWPIYQHLSVDDVNAIVAYLRSIPAIEHRVPQRVAPGTRAATPYVYFGVFRSGPEIRGH